MIPIENMSPLDVLLYAMRSKLRQDDIDGAAVFARIVAPYLHARSREMPDKRRVISELQLVSDAELFERLVEARKRVTDQNEPTNQPAIVGDRGSEGH